MSTQVSIRVASIGAALSAFFLVGCGHEGSSHQLGTGGGPLYAMDGYFYGLYEISR